MRPYEFKIGLNHFLLDEWAWTGPSQRLEFLPIWATETPL
jgi:hypothetical protein